MWGAYGRQKCSGQRSRNKAVDGFLDRMLPRNRSLPGIHRSIGTGIHHKRPTAQLYPPVHGMLCTTNEIQCSRFSRKGQMSRVFAARLKEHCGRSNGSLPADMSTALDCTARQGQKAEPGTPNSMQKKVSPWHNSSERQSHLGEPVASRVKCCLYRVKDKRRRGIQTWNGSIQTSDHGSR
jgi:hypothetical protein